MATPHPAPAVVVGLREVDPRNRPDVATVVKLHMRLLHFGPFAQFGELFLRRFCYTMLLANGLMRAALCEVDGRPAGFVAYTDRSITFHRSALRKHWLRAGVLVAASVLRNPRLLRPLLRVLRVMISRREEVSLAEDPLGELIAIGVLPHYCSPAFVRRSNRRIAEELVLYCAARLRRAGVEKMRMIVDDDNKAPLLLYHQLGARFESYEQAGKPQIHVWFDLNRQLPDSTPEVLQ